MKRPSARTVLIGIALFLVFLIWRFPYRNLRGYVFGVIYKNTQVRIESEDLSPVFLGWPGVTLYNATVSVPFGRMQEIDIQAEEITARVGIGGLFPPVPSFSAYLYKLRQGGNLWVKGTSSSNYFAGSLTAEKVNLAPFLQFGLPEPIQGMLNGSGSFNYDLVDLSKSNGTFGINVDKFKIPAMNLDIVVLPMVAWEEVRAKVEIKNGSLEVTQCQFGTPKSDFRGSLAATVRLGRDWMSSHIDATLKIQMSESYRNDPQSVTLVSFLKTYEITPGDYALKWSATPAEMSSNLMLALPQKP